MCTLGASALAGYRKESGRRISDGMSMAYLCGKRHDEGM